MLLVTRCEGFDVGSGGCIDVKGYFFVLSRLLCGLGSRTCIGRFHTLISGNILKKKVVQAVL